MAKKGQNLNTLPGGKLNNLLNQNFDKFKNFQSSKKFYLVLLIVGILLLAIYKKSWFVAAIVDSMPITNLELQMKLNDQYRAPILDQLITRKIILNEASKNNVIPNPQEVDSKLAELEASVGGKDTFNTILTQQGQTRSGIKERITIQLALTKLYDKEATVSTEEVAKFIKENSAVLQSTDSAKQQQEAYDLLKQQKISEIFNQKFQELRQKAKIVIF
ncbi:SurA N-terminal domain-containing protein [Candidatus Daviesbacteria bacterium]|nr:SurA N-terminal domain-containing protein [Candidatus Daviesbacteria bacterium]